MQSFQMFKLGLKIAKEPKIQCQCLLDHRDSKGIPEKKTSTSVSLTIPMPLTVWIIKICGWQMENLRDGNTRSSYLSPEKPVCGPKSNS